MKYITFSGILRKLFASFFIAYFAVFSPVSIVLAQDNIGIGSTAPISSPSPSVSPSPTPSPTPTTTPAPSATITVSPTTVDRNGILNVAWSGIPNPNAKDIIQFVTNGLTQIVGNGFWINSCVVTPSTAPTGTPQTSGSCLIDLTKAGISSGVTTLNVVLYSGVTAGQIVAVSNQFTLSSVPLDAGLVNYWKMDEGSGYTTADSIGSDTGVLSNTAWTATSVKPSFRNALVFDNTGPTGMRLNNPVSLGNNFTVSGWVNFSNLDSQFGKTIFNNGQLLLRLDPSSEGKKISSIIVLNGSFRPRLSWGPPTTGTFYHVAVTGVYSSINHSYTHTFYINGNQVGSQVESGTFASAESTIIGNGGSGGVFTGTMDDIRIYNRTLSSAEVQQLYNYSPPVLPTPTPTPSPTSKPLSCENYGDLDRDGKITDADVTLLQQYVDGTKKFQNNDPLQIIADVNSDNKVDSTDLAQLKQYLSGGINQFDVCKQAKLPVCNNLGDVTGDGKVTAMDAQEVLRMVVGYTDSLFTNKTYTAEQRRRADIDKSGDTSAGDALRILRFVAGLDDGTKFCSWSSPKPDLVVLSSTPEAQLVEGQYGLIDVVVKNIGNADAGGFSVNYFLKRLDNNGVLQADWGQVASLKAGASTTLTFKYPYPFPVSGKYSVSGTVDALSQVSESDETNNNYSFYLNVLPRLEITSVFPANPRQGDLVTITGRGFVKDAAANLVYVGDVLMPTQFNKVSVDGKTLTFMLTTETPFRINSSYPVRVKIPDGPSWSNSINITITSPTSLSSITPSGTAVGATVILKGQNFGKAQGSVFFYDLNYKFVAGASIQAWSDNIIQIKVPVVAVDKEYLVVVNGSFGGKFIYSSNALNFKVLPSPKISSVTPQFAVVGSIAQVAGSNFGNSQGSVTFYNQWGQASGGAPILGWYDGGVKFKVPSVAKGTYSIEVQTASGVKSNRVSFTVTAALPAISSISPSTLKPGTYMFISGSNFGFNTGKINFYIPGSIVASASAVNNYWSNSLIIAQIPPTIKANQQYGIQVRTLVGTDLLDSSLVYRYISK